MKITKLEVCREGRSYIFGIYTGLLLEKEGAKISNFKDHLTPRVSAALELNDAPYLLHKLIKVDNDSLSISTPIIIYTKLLIIICKYSFFLTRILTIFRFSLYKNATEAIFVFRKTAPKEIQNNLCLPRALFAAITSKKFKEKGVVFIGISLPSKSMHAWVIEDGIQPDPYDNIWINYQPVAVIW